jgi:hypothetical protein
MNESAPRFPFVYLFERCRSLQRLSGKYLEKIGRDEPFGFDDRSIQTRSHGGQPRDPHVIPFARRLERSAPDSGQFPPQAGQVLFSLSILFHDLFVTP